MKKLKAMFIHGLHSGADSDTGRYVKDVLESYGIEVLPLKNYDVFNPDETIRDINETVAREHVNIVVGHSFGGFYTLASNHGPIKIVINPCMQPSIEIPLLDDSITTDVIDRLAEIEDVVYNNIDAEERGSVFAGFGSDDDLFSSSQMGLFKIFYSNRFKVLDGCPHKPQKEDVISLIDLAFRYYGIFDDGTGSLDESVKLTERFKNVFPKQSSSSELEKYGPMLYELLVKVYERDGGMAGINSYEDFMNDCGDMWKLNFKNGKLVAAMVYTFGRGGRKLVAGGALPDDDKEVFQENKAALYQIIVEDLSAPGPQGAKNREFWAEVSHGFENVYTKKFGDLVDIIDPSIVKRLLADKTFGDDVEDGKHYNRLIGGKDFTKIAVASKGYDPNPSDEYVQAKLEKKRLAALKNKK